MLYNVFLLLDIDNNKKSLELHFRRATTSDFTTKPQFLYLKTLMYFKQKDKTKACETMNALRIELDNLLEYAQDNAEGLIFTTTNVDSGVTEVRDKQDEIFRHLGEVLWVMYSTVDWYYKELFPSVD